MGITVGQADILAVGRPAAWLQPVPRIPLPHMCHYVLHCQPLLLARLCQHQLHVNVRVILLGAAPLHRLLRQSVPDDAVAGHLIQSIEGLVLLFLFLRLSGWDDLQGGAAGRQAEQVQHVQRAGMPSRSGRVTRQHVLQAGLALLQQVLYMHTCYTCYTCYTAAKASHT
jgi:hypothetical protein